MTWKARQRNFVCYLHMWISSVLQARLFLLKIMRERAVSKGCSSVPVLVRHRRPFIAKGGTFTKEIFNLTILFAVSVDASNHPALLAWAIVEGGNQSSWRFFLSNLYAAIPEVNHPATTGHHERSRYRPMCSRQRDYPSCPCNRCRTSFPQRSKELWSSFTYNFQLIYSFCSY